MRKSTTFIAITIFALMLGACASTNDTSDRPEHSTESNNNPTELPSMAEKQTQIAYTDISASASTKEVVTSETPVLQSSATVTQSTDPSLTSSTTSSSSSTSTTTTLTAPSSTTTTQTMTSSSTVDDTDDDTDDDTATASRTRLRKD